MLFEEFESQYKYENVVKGLPGMEILLRPARI
jgi:hypothetical protein